MRANHRPKQVHEEHGAAMYEAQLLEQYLGHAVLAASDMTGMSFKNLERIVRKSSIAQLMRQLDTVVAVPPRFRARLEAARIVRNQLAHNYFATRSEFFQTAEGRAVMIHELDNVGEEFYQLWGVLDSAVIAWLARDQPRAVEFGEDLAKAAGEA